MLLERLLPVLIWGTTFIVPSLSYQNNVDVTHVASSPENVFFISIWGQRTAPFLLAANFFLSGLTHSEPLYIFADANLFRNKLNTVCVFSSHVSFCFLKISLSAAGLGKAMEATPQLYRGTYIALAF